ncbi:MAG: glycosyltransferase, partial [Ornithinimicrobium sp.]
LHLVNYGWPYVDGYTARSRSIVSAQRRELGIDAIVAVGPYPAFAQARDTGLVADGWGPEQLLVPGTGPRRGERPALGLAPRSGRAFVRGLVEVLDTVRPDVVHSHHPAFVGRAGLAAARQRKLPFVYEVRCFNGDYDLDARHPYLRARGHRQNRLELALCRAADRVVTISSGLAERVIAGGVPLERVDVVRNAVDTELWRTQPRSEHPGTLRIGYATTFEAIEGLDLLVAAVEQAAPVLATRGVTLEVVLAGTGRDWDRIRQLIIDAGLESVIELPGFLTRDALHEFYGDLDLFVVPRRPAAVSTDTTPLKPLEALANGRPLLTTDLPALRELLQDQPAVRFVTPDADGLAAGILDFAEQPWHPQTPVDLGERSWASEVHRYNDVYRKTMESTHG